MDGFKSLSTLPFGVLDPKMACKLKTHGLLCALHIFALGQPPVPCSPFLLIYVLGNFNLLFDTSYIRMLAPEAAHALSVIPSNHNSPLDLSPTGPLASLLATYLMIQVSRTIMSLISGLTRLIACTTCARYVTCKTSRVATAALCWCSSWMSISIHVRCPSRILSVC